MNAVGLDYRLVYPMFALVVLTAIVLAILFRSRVRAVRQGNISTAYFRVYQGEREPEQAAKASRHFSNLFEAPTLFYVACLTGLITHDGSVWLLCLAWAYVIARTAHAIIHLGRNRLRQRIPAYFVGWIVLAIMWVHVVVHAALAH